MRTASCVPSCTAPRAPSRAGFIPRTASRLRPLHAPSRAGFTFTISMVVIIVTLIGAASFAQEWRKSQQASTTKIVPSEALRLHGRVGSDVRQMMGAGAKVSTDNVTGTTTLSLSLTQPFKREGEPIAQISDYSASMPSNLRNLGYEVVLSMNDMSGSNATVIITSKNGSLVNSNDGAYDVTSFYHPMGLAPNSIITNIFCNKQADSVGDLVVSGSSNSIGGSSVCSATGGTMTVVGDYCVHTFTSSGTFTANSTLTAEVLVVAGGGAGGSESGDTYGGGGGGGAGGLIHNTSYAVTTGAITVTVGAGGTKTSTTKGGAGGNSVFGSIMAIGGGGGGSGSGTVAGGSGGSGGGAGASVGVSGTAGSGTSGQGYGGGISIDNGYQTGGGGGGAGGVGANTTPYEGAGGAGVSKSLIGSAVTYAAGGAGSNANGGPARTDAAANTGNGGQGNHNNLSGSGGSGIVIVRYPITTPTSSSSGYYYVVNYSEPDGRSYTRNYFAPRNSTTTMSVTYPDDTLLYFESVFSPNATQNRTSIHYTKSSSGALILPFNTNISNSTGVVRDYSLFKESVTLASNASNTPEWRSDCSRGSSCYYFDGTDNMYVLGGVALTGSEIPMPLGSEMINDPWFEATLLNSLNKWGYWADASISAGDSISAASGVIPMAGSGSGWTNYTSACINTTRYNSMARIYNIPSASVFPSAIYTISFWARNTGPAGRYKVQANNSYLTASGSWNATGDFLPVTNSPTRVQNSRTFTTPPGTGYQDLTVSLYGGSEPGSVCFDGVSIKQSMGMNGGFESYYNEGATIGPVQ